MGHPTCSCGMGIRAVVAARVGMDSCVGEAGNLLEEGLTGRFGDGVSAGHGEVLIHDQVRFSV